MLGVGINVGVSGRAGAASAGGGGDVTAPTLVSATIPTGGGYIDLVYNESLDTGSTPATGDFAITVPSGSPPTISGISFQTTSVSNDTVRVSVATPFYEPEADSFGSGIQVSYTADANPIQDAAGNDAANLTDEEVTNNSTQWPLTANGSAHTPEGGTLAGFLVDVSGNGNDLVTAGNDPAIDAVTYGSAAVDFDGTDDNLAMSAAFVAAFSGADEPVTVIFGIRPETQPRGFFGIKDGASNYHLLVNYLSGDRVQVQRAGTSSPTSGADFPINSWSTGGVFHTGTSVEITDGAGNVLASFANDSANDTAATQAFLGYSTFSYLDGQFGRFVADNETKTGRDRSVLLTWVHDYTLAM